MNNYDPFFGLSISDVQNLAQPRNIIRWSCNLGGITQKQINNNDNRWQKSGYLFIQLWPFPSRTLQKDGGGLIEMLIKCNNSSYLVIMQTLGLFDPSQVYFVFFFLSFHEKNRKWKKQQQQQKKPKKEKENEKNAWSKETKKENWYISKTVKVQHPSK